MIERKNPLWVIGAHPCTSFSIWNHGINHKRMDPQKVRDQLKEGRLHLQCACSLYRRQVAACGYFLHEHPATAMSWNEDSIHAVARMPTVHTVVGDQCQYGLVTPSEADPKVMVPALKPTKFMTNSQVMRDQLGRRCSRDHVHQPLVGGRCKNAAFYPVKLVKAILRGIALQAEQDFQRKRARRHTDNEINQVFAIPMPRSADPQKNAAPP